MGGRRERGNQGRRGLVMWWHSWVEVCFPKFPSLRISNDRSKEEALWGCLQGTLLGHLHPQHEVVREPPLPLPSSLCSLTPAPCAFGHSEWFCFLQEAHISEVKSSSNYTAFQPSLRAPALRSSVAGWWKAFTDVLLGVSLHSVTTWHGPGWGQSHGKNWQCWARGLASLVYKQKALWSIAQVQPKAYFWKVLLEHKHTL